MIKGISKLKKLDREDLITEIRERDIEIKRLLKESREESIRWRSFYKTRKKKESRKKNYCNKWIVEMRCAEVKSKLNEQEVENGNR